MKTKKLPKARKAKKPVAEYKCCPMCETFGAGPCQECDRLNVEPWKGKRKALVLWMDHDRLTLDTKAWHDYCVPVAVIPCPSLRSARALAAWANKSSEQQVEEIARVLAKSNLVQFPHRIEARAILAMLKGGAL